MCGIAGFVGIGSRTDIQRITRALAHRGPDGAGFFVDDAAHVFLGHRRLAILDVAGGEQPMWNEDGQIGVVFNGEIYNHADLRVELQAHGHRFATDHSDTEVLVHGYEEWGVDLPLRLNGMFAFAILDRRRKRMFLARDRFGEKPVYYTAKSNLFAFASELAALTEHPGVSRSINVQALQKFFAYGYLPAPHALLEGVRKLPGGHWLTYDLNSGAIVETPYWRFILQTDDSLSDADEPRLVEECAALLTKAVQRRMMGDVPLGVFLSGGLDSSIVLASISRNSPEKTFDAFTIGFDESSFDETKHARAVARRLGAAHHLRRLNLTQARDLIDSLPRRLDEPLGDASLLPTYLLSSLAREKVAIALSGDGADELFAGYDPFLALRPAATYARVLPTSWHEVLRRVVDLMPISESNMSPDFRLRRVMMGLSHSASMWLPIWMAPLDPRDAAELFETPLRIEEVYDEAIAAWESDPTKSPVDRALEFFTRFYLQDDILMKLDRAAMMCSLETRTVFLDNDLVDFCRRLPYRFKLRNGERKYLLKKAARRVLPPSIVDRKKKGLGIPVAKWLREVPHEPPLTPLPGARVDYARRAFAEHRSKAHDHRLFLWSWIGMQGFSTRLREIGAAQATEVSR